MWVLGVKQSGSRYRTHDVFADRKNRPDLPLQGENQFIISVPVILQTTTDLLKELTKANIQVLTTETFADDPTVQVKGLKVSNHLTCS